MRQCDCGDCDICGSEFGDTFDEPSFDPYAGEICRYCREHVTDSGCGCEPDEKDAREKETEERNRKAREERERLEEELERERVDEERRRRWEEEDRRNDEN